MKRNYVTFDELLQSYSAGERDFTNLNFSSGKTGVHQNLVGVDLRRTDFRGSKFWVKDFTEINLNGSNLSRVDFEAACFDGAFLIETNFSDCSFWKASLEGADLTRANLIGADFQCANLWGADLSYANLTGVRFDNTDLCSANLTGAILDETTGFAEVELFKTIMPDGTINKTF